MLAKSNPTDKSLALQTSPDNGIERVLVQGDLSQLSERDRLAYYHAVCRSLGLNWLTRPFEYIRLQGKLTLYAKRECCEQLRRLHGVSVQIISRELWEGDDIYVVIARATLPCGRCDESIGAVYLNEAVGDIRASLVMKAESKAKRRATLSLCGLGFLDETEVASIPDARPEPEPWRTWRDSEDAIAWGSMMLPDISTEVLRQEFEALEPRNGKKAVAWYERIQQIILHSDENH